jgi:hypothetical protein
MSPLLLGAKIEAWNDRNITGQKPDAMVFYEKIKKK